MNATKCGTMREASLLPVVTAIDLREWGL